MIYVMLGSVRDNFTDEYPINSQSDNHTKLSPKRFFEVKLDAWKMGKYSLKHIG